MIDTELTAEERAELVRRVGVETIERWDGTRSAYPIIGHSNVFDICAAIIAGRKPVRWVPKEGKEMWVISDEGTVEYIYSFTPDRDGGRVHSGNCYPTREAAEAAARLRHVRETADRLHREIVGDWAPQAREQSYSFRILAASPEGIWTIRAFADYHGDGYRFPTSGFTNEQFKERLETECGPDALWLLLTGKPGEASNA